MSTNPAVTVYTAGDRCMACKLTVRALDERGIAYRSIDLHTDGAARDYVAQLGHHAAPVVIVDDGHTIRDWSGYRPDAINALTTHPEM